VKILMCIRMIMSVGKLTELFTKLVAIPAQCLTQSSDKEVLPRTGAHQAGSSQPAS